MRRPTRSCLVLLGALAASVGPSAAVASADVSLLPVGDSITQGFGGQCGYRKFLSRTLFRHPSCEVAFVGPLVHAFDGGRDDPSCAATETPSLAVSGRTARDLHESGDLFRAVLADTPDYVLLHMGSNDMRLGESVPVIADLNDRLIGQVFDAHPGATVLLAGIIPWDPVPRPEYERDPADAPDVDEAARSDEIASALGTLAAERRAAGFDVVYVDMRPGFDSPTMTYDGVHPNEIGEAHIGQRFLDALVADGACPPNPLPTLTLAPNAWYQISLPGDPDGRDRVGDVFGPALDANRLGDTWSLFAFDGVRYATPGVEDRLESGRGYWIIQQTGAARTIRLPAGTLPVALADASDACTAPRGCAAVALEASVDRARWNLLGSPLNGSSPLADARVASAAAPCDGRGCTLPEAGVGQGGAGLLYEPFFAWDPTRGANGEYRRLRAGDTLAPWQGLWAATAPEARDAGARLVLAPR